MEVFLTLVWFLAGATTGWVLTLIQAARTTTRTRQQTDSQIRYWQSETERYKATADRHAQEKEAWAAGAKQGRDDVITIMPMLLAAQQRSPSQNGAAGASAAAVAPEPAGPRAS